MQPDLVRRSHHIEQALDRYGFHIMIGECDFTSKPLWHWHTGVEVTLFHSGTAEVFTRTWRTSLLPGEAVIAPASVHHGSRGTFSRTVLHLDPALVPPQHRRFIDRVLDSPDGTPFTPTPAASERFIWIAQQLAKARLQRAPLLTIQALLGVVLADIETQVASSTEDRYPDPVRLLITYMHTNPESGESVDELIERLGYSRSHVYDLFSEHVGCTPGACWSHIRQEHAGKLLRQGWRVHDVATAIGFSSVRGFQRAFHKHYGMSPAEYRRTMT